MTKAQRTAHKLGNIKRWKLNRSLQKRDISPLGRWLDGAARQRGFSLQGAV